MTSLHEPTAEQAAERIKAWRAFAVVNKPGYDHLRDVSYSNHPVSDADLDALLAERDQLRRELAEARDDRDAATITAITTGAERDAALATIERIDTLVPLEHCEGAVVDAARLREILGIGHLEGYCVVSGQPVRYGAGDRCRAHGDASEPCIGRLRRPRCTHPGGSRNGSGRCDECGRRLPEPQEPDSGDARQTTTRDEVARYLTDAGREDIERLVAEVAAEEGAQQAPGAQERDADGLPTPPAGNGNGGAKTDETGGRAENGHAWFDPNREWRTHTATDIEAFGHRRDSAERHIRALAAHDTTATLQSRTVGPWADAAPTGNGRDRA